MLIGVCAKIMPLTLDLLNQRNSIRSSIKCSGEKEGSLGTFILQAFQYNLATFSVFMSGKHQGNSWVPLVPSDNSPMYISQIPYLSPAIKRQVDAPYECKAKDGNRSEHWRQRIAAKVLQVACTKYKEMGGEKRTSSLFAIPPPSPN